jgi:hypothetical protein
MTALIDAVTVGFRNGNQAGHATRIGVVDQYRFGAAALSLNPPTG